MVDTKEITTEYIILDSGKVYYIEYTYIEK